MGIDWITKCAPAWKRGWDRGLKKLSRPNLFTQFGPDVEITFRVKSLGGFEFCVGVTHQLRLSGEVILVIDGGGVRVAGECRDAPSRILKRIRESGCGVAIGVVRQVYAFTKSAEIAVI